MPGCPIALRHDERGRSGLSPSTCGPRPSAETLTVARAFMPVPAALWRVRFTSSRAIRSAAPSVIGSNDISERARHL
jgi:hypothetical protein